MKETLRGALEASRRRASRIVTVHSTGRWRRFGIRARLPPLLEWTGRGFAGNGPFNSPVSLLADLGWVAVGAHWLRPSTSDLVIFPAGPLLPTPGKIDRPRTAAAPGGPPARPSVTRRGVVSARVGGEAGHRRPPGGPPRSGGGPDALAPALGRDPAINLSDGDRVPFLGKQPRLMVASAGDGTRGRLVRWRSRRCRLNRILISRRP